MSEQTNRKYDLAYRIVLPSTHTPILSPKTSHPQISPSGIAMLSMLTMAIPDNGL